MTPKLCVPSCSRAFLGESEQANVAELSLVPPGVNCLWCHFLSLTGAWGEVKFPAGPREVCLRRVGLDPIGYIEFGARLI